MSQTDPKQYTQNGRVFRTLSIILDGAFLESRKRLKILKYFREKIHLRLLTGKTFHKILSRWEYPRGVF